MQSGKLPTLRAARNALLNNGEIAGLDQLVTLQGFFYQHPTEGLQRVAVDPRIFEHTTMYLNNPILAQLLKRQGAHIQPMQQAIKLLQTAYKDHTRLIWGVCGYASGGHPYHGHYKWMKALYDQLKKPRWRPAFIIDGGGKYGVLGLNSVLAKERKIPTIGMVPYPGLDGWSWRDHTIIGENSYEKREKWVGGLGDIMLCVLGGEAAMRERHKAALEGAVIVDLIPHNYPSVPTHKLVKCQSIRDIPLCLAEAKALARYDLKESRQRRAKALPGLLAT